MIITGSEKIKGIRPEFKTYMKVNRQNVRRAIKEEAKDKRDKFQVCVSVCVCVRIHI